MNSPCAKVLAFGQNACTAQTRRGPEGPFSAGLNIDFDLSCQLVASDISLATSFFISFQSASRAHSAAPRFQPRPACAGRAVGGRPACRRQISILTVPSKNGGLKRYRTEKPSIFKASKDRRSTDMRSLFFPYFTLLPSLRQESNSHILNYYTQPNVQGPGSCFYRLPALLLRKWYQSVNMEGRWPWIGQ